MSDTSISTSHALTVEQWEAKLFKQYLGELRYKPLMSTSMTSPIVVKENLMKAPGDVVNVGFRTALTGAGVTGTTALEGSEEALSFYNQAVTINLIRNGVRIDGKMTEQRVAFNMREEAKDTLTLWAAHKVQDDIATEFNTIDGVNYASATEGEKDTWLTNNADRVLFGAATSNNSANDHSSSLANIDSTNDVLSPAIISLAKRMAKLANPKIEPIKVENGVEMYVMIAHPYAFRDLVTHATMTGAQREVFPRLGNDHPLIKGQAFLYWDGVLVIESEDVLLLDGVGATSSDVAGNVLLGAGSILYAQGGIGGASRMEWVEETFDYAAKVGFAVSMIYGVEKARYNSKDRLVTVYTSAQPD